MLAIITDTLLRHNDTKLKSDQWNYLRESSMKCLIIMDTGAVQKPDGKRMAGERFLSC